MSWSYSKTDKVSVLIVDLRNNFRPLDISMGLLDPEKRVANNFKEMALAALVNGEDPNRVYKIEASGSQTGTSDTAHVAIEPQ